MSRWETTWLGEHAAVGGVEREKAHLKFTIQINNEDEYQGHKNNNDSSRE